MIRQLRFTFILSASALPADTATVIFAGLSYVKKYTNTATSQWSFGMLREVVDSSIGPAPKITSSKRTAKPDRILLLLYYFSAVHVAEGRNRLKTRDT